MSVITIDYHNPQYQPIYVQRSERLAYIRTHPEELPLIRSFYRNAEGGIAQFMTDWGVTVDPREIAKGRPAFFPFVLFPKQLDWINWLIRKWRANEPGLTEKSRDVGVSWIAVGVACSLGIFYDDFTAGFGSQQWDKVDSLGDPGCLFYKARMFMSHLPVEFRGGFDLKKHSPEGKILIPDTRSQLIGECGDNIGRGARSSIFFVDEAAQVEHPQVVDSSLSANTDCRQDISSVSLDGMANAFAIKRHSGNIEVFTIHWTDDPRKNYPGSDWESKKRADLVDPVVFEADYNINYQAATEGAVIHSSWVEAAVNAEAKLAAKGITLAREGIRIAALDVADSGADKNSLAQRHGPVLTSVNSWKGTADLDIGHTVDHAFGLCDVFGLTGFDYDSDGLGAGVRGFARIVNTKRKEDRKPLITVLPFWGSGKVLFEEKKAPGTDRMNKDFFENRKAQGWWTLRHRFLATFRALNGDQYNAADLIAIDPSLPELVSLKAELSQPTWGLSKNGKILIEKQPEGTKSPNLADSVMMVFAPRTAAMVFSPSTLEASAHAPGKR